MTLHVGISDRGIATPALADDRLVLVPWHEYPSPEALWRRAGDSTVDLLRAASRAPGLRWVHLDTVGVERLPLDEWRTRGITVTVGRGLSTAQVAEWTLAAMLLAVRRLHETVRLSAAARWEPPRGTIGTLRARRVTVVGMGAIGTRVADLASVLGAVVTGVVRSEPATDDPRRASTASLVTSGRLRDACRGAELLVLCAPATEQTRSMISADVLAELSPSAWVVNGARGALVDEHALVEAVASRRIAGAVLDVACQEPLPPDSPLWGHADIVLSPHLADHPRADAAAALSLFLQEADLFLHGERPRTAVEPGRGY